MPRYSGGIGGGGGEDQWKRESEALDAAIRANGKDRPVSADPPELPDLAGFYGLEFPPREPILGPIQSSHMVLAAGATGAGKTQMAVAITKALGTGTDWGRWKSHRPLTVLHIDGELPPGDLQARFQAQHVPKDARVIPLSAIWLADTYGLGHINLAEPSWQEVIWHYVKRYGAEVVQFDNVMSLVSVPNTSMSSDEFWYPMATFLRRLRGHGVTSITWDHLNDQGRVFGTKTKEWQADLVFTVEMPSDKAQTEGAVFTVTFTKTRGLHGAEVAPFEAKLLTGPDGSPVWVTKHVEDRNRENARKYAADGMTQREIAAQIGVSLGTVNKLLKEAREIRGE